VARRVKSLINVASKPLPGQKALWKPACLMSTSNFQQLHMEIVPEACALLWGKLVIKPGHQSADGLAGRVCFEFEMKCRNFCVIWQS
jgi:hypothetical protein